MLVTSYSKGLPIMAKTEIQLLSPGSANNPADPGAAARGSDDTPGTPTALFNHSHGIHPVQPPSDNPALPLLLPETNLQVSIHKLNILSYWSVSCGLSILHIKFIPFHPPESHLVMWIYWLHCLCADFWHSLNTLPHYPIHTLPNNNCLDPATTYNTSYIGRKMLRH